MQATQSAAGGDIREFTVKAVAVGVLLGVLFGAANAYLGLKAGLTVSTSIPIAVLAAMVFRLAPRGGTILEANMAQTIGSASSSLASGTIFTIPALFLWGIVPSLWQVAALAFAGGVLGIFAMVPLRRMLMVQAAKELPYPEGRACAEVLHATQKGGDAGRWIVVGILVGGIVKLVLTTTRVLPEEVAWAPPGMLNATLALKIAPALLAVGYIVGFRASAVMVAGGFIASLVLYPLATKAHLAGLADAGADAKALGAGAVKDRFLLYIGAGAVAAAGIVTVVKTAPTMWSSLKAVFGGFGKQSAAPADRADRDIPMPLVLGGLAGLVLALTLVPGIFAGDFDLGTRFIAALFVAVFGLLFVPVSSRLVGVIGVSSNPTSAMALITLAGSAAIFATLGWKGVAAQAAVLTVGTVVCVAASKAGDISQDLKTGQLVGGTPYLQQYGQLVAASVACFAVAGVVIAIGNGEGFGPDGMPAPQARLMKTMVEAVLGASLPWDLLASGGALGLVGVLLGLPALPFALGIYLPLSTLACVFLGGVVRAWVEARAKRDAGWDAEKGVLCASGFVAGEGLAGVLVAGWAYATDAGRPEKREYSGLLELAALGLLFASAVVLARSTRKTAS